MSTLDIVIPCKGRLEHLQRSLPATLASTYEDFTVYVVDFNCPDKTADWVEAEITDKRVNVVRVDCPADYWNTSKARNVGMRAGTSSLILFNDADVILTPDCLKTIVANYRKGFYYPFSRNMGSILLARADAERIGGFNERCKGWGWEEVDFCKRLEICGLQRQKVIQMCELILHADSLRNRFHGGRSCIDTRYENILVSDEDIATGRSLPFQTAVKQIVNEVKEASSPSGPIKPIQTPAGQRKPPVARPQTMRPTPQMPVKKVNARG